MSDDYTRLRGQAEWSLKIDHVPAALENARSNIAALDEITVLRAEVAALTAELTELRALRDRLLAYGIAGHLLDSYGEEFEAIIARAQELAD